MEAHNRKLSDWFGRISTGQILLPRFQRHEAWGANEVAGLLAAVARELPSGATLILDVGDEEPFVSRPLQGAPEPTARVTEHLLDGQQRLTALWRAMHDDYEERTYFLRFAEDEDHPELGDQWHVESRARWFREVDGEMRRYPLWLDDPEQLFGEGLIPARLLRPGDLQSEVTDWVDQAVGETSKLNRDLTMQIIGLRATVAGYNIPYLALPVTTPKDVALEVFIRMNTSAVRLTSFDIVVAQFEASTGQSLHDLVEAVEHKVPGASRYRDVGNWVLDTAALRAGNPPTQASYLRLDLQKMASEWDEIVAGIEFAVDVLDEEKVFDSDRLPTVAVLPVLAALRRSLPKDPDGLGNAKTLLRRYLWRSFLTRRYEQSAATRSLQDFVGLKAILEGGSGEPPIFDEGEFPLPTTAEILSAGWPKRRDILGRGLLAVALRAGARDLADDARATELSVTQREYHHLFPDSVLQKDGGLAAQASFKALNCALITWQTNRKISAKEPLQYLRDRAEASNLGEQVVRERLASHLIPYDVLAAAGGWSEFPAEERRQAIRDSYDEFISQRAEAFIKPIHDLCQGTVPAHLWQT